MKCIDLFAGAGGFSEGAKQAGAEILWAGNHWQTAVTTHIKNHPQTQHVCQDLHQANWLEVPAHDLLLASPACQGHSRARGVDRAHHDVARSTAWAVVSAAEFHRPKAFIVENVPDLARWALFPAWEQAMKALGYTMSSAILDAQFFGVPQERKRLFIVGMLGNKPFRFRTTRPSEDLVPIRSVLRPNEGVWSPIDDIDRLALGKRPLADATKARIAVGRKRFGRALHWFPYFGSNIAGYSVDRPLWTLTTRDRYALIEENRMRILMTSEVQAAMGFPDDYILTGKSKVDKFMLGNAVCPPVARWLVSEIMEAA